MAIVRRSCTSSSFSVCVGATTIDSPVWMPIGSKFSMAQTVMQLSSASRTTSTSISFQPARYSSTSTCRMPPSKLRLSAGSISSAEMTALPRPPSANATRSIAGRPTSRTARRACVERGAGDAPGALDPDLFESLLEPLPILRVPDGADWGAEHAHAEPLEHAHAPPSSSPQFSPVWPPKPSKIPSHSFLLEDLFDVVGRDGHEIHPGRQGLRWSGWSRCLG